MAELKENAITLLSTTTGIDMSESTGDDVQVVLYTVPSGKTAIITHVVVRNPSSSLASASSVAFGNNSATYNNWDSALTLAACTASTMAIVVVPTTAGAAAVTVCAAGTEFSMLITTGAGAACTATIDVFGYLY